MELNFSKILLGIIIILTFIFFPIIAGIIFIIIVVLKLNIDMGLNKFCKIERYIDFYKILLGIIIFAFFALFPIIFAMIGGYIEGLIRGIPIHEGNSGIFSFFWFSFITIPIGGILLIIWIIISIKNINLFYKNKKMKYLDKTKWINNFNF